CGPEVVDANIPYLPPPPFAVNGLLRPPTRPHQSAAPRVRGWPRRWRTRLPWSAPASPGVRETAGGTLHSRIVHAHIPHTRCSGTTVSPRGDTCAPPPRPGFHRGEFRSHAALSPARALPAGAWFCGGAAWSSGRASRARDNHRSRYSADRESLAPEVAVHH